MSHQQILHDHLDRNVAIKLLQGAIAHESITGNEANFVSFLQQHMNDLHLDPYVSEFAEGRPNILGVRKGTGGGPLLQIMGHTDTVHARGWSECWQGTERENPFGGAIVDGELWGRGAGDLKAGICTSLAALQLLDRAGITLKGDVAFAFIGDEESGEDGSGVSAGVKAWTQEVLAGAVARPDFTIYVEPTQLGIYPAQMGFFITDVTVTGKSAYFGVPEKGVDALKATHSILSAIWQHSDDIAARAEHELIGRAFVLVTGIEGGGYIAVPGECKFSLIRKLLPGESLDTASWELEAVIHEAVGYGISVSFEYPAGRDHALGGSPALTDPNIEPVQKLRQAISEIFPGRGEISGAPYWSEMSFLVNEIGCPAVYCAPGDISNCHTLEERVNLDEYMAGILGFALFFINYCGATTR